MESLRIAICEDLKEEQEKLLAILQKSKIPTKTDIFICGEDFLGSYQQRKYDLIFMDIYMDGMTGVEAVTAIRKMDEDVPVAFTTTSTDHTLESYRLEALKYIEKPVKEKAVFELLEMARLKKENTPRLILKIGGKECSVPFERILFAEQKAHQLLIHLTGAEELTVNEKLDTIEAQFVQPSFYRCHKSYLVNLAYVAEFDRELMMFVMKEGVNVHIRRESIGKAKKAFEGFLFDAARGISK